MFLGAAGMGCALALTYRERQRKVQVGLCNTCHTHYGATVDSKSRPVISREKSYAPRRPSRVIYSYNGNSHKFYTSYGSINENQTVEMKCPSMFHCSGKHQTTTETSSELSSASLQQESNSNIQETDTESPVKKYGDTATANGAKERLDSHSDGENMVSESPDQNSEGKDSQVSEQTVPSEERNQSESISFKLEQNLNTKDNNSELPSSNPPKTITHGSSENKCGTDRDNSAVKKALKSKSFNETAEKVCDCPARYIYRRCKNRQCFHRTAPLMRSPRYQHPHPGSKVPASARYHKKLIMQCNLRGAKNVPLNLFTVRSTSNDDSDCQDVVSDGIPSESKTSSPRLTSPSGTGTPCSCPVPQSLQTGAVTTDVHGRTGATHDDIQETDLQDREAITKTAGLDTHSCETHETEHYRLTGSDSVNEGSELKNNTPAPSVVANFTCNGVRARHCRCCRTGRLLPLKLSPPSLVHPPTTRPWSSVSSSSSVVDVQHYQCLGQITSCVSQNPIHESSQISGHIYETQNCFLSEKSVSSSLVSVSSNVPSVYSDVESVSSERGLLSQCSKNSSVKQYDQSKSPLLKSFCRDKKDQRSRTELGCEVQNDGSSNQDSSQANTGSYLYSDFMLSLSLSFVSCSVGVLDNFLVPPPHFLMLNFVFH